VDRQTLRFGCATRWLPIGIIFAVAYFSFSVTGHADTLLFPDLHVIVPTDATHLVIANPATGRELRYTHDTANSGPGPLEIQPFYSTVSGNYQGFQHVYSQHGTTWTLRQTTPVAGAFVFDMTHGHFHFPFSAFGLYRYNPDGSVGAPVALSPKTGFCIENSFVYDQALASADTFPHQWGTCPDPTHLRGLSIGYVDDYDYTDPGQSIPIPAAKVPDGDYWLRAHADPDNYLLEANEANNITDVHLRIIGNTIQAFEIQHPDSTPPTANLTSLVDGQTYSGTITLTATTQMATSPPGGVQFLLDGLPLGPIVPPPPSGPVTYTYTWDTTMVPDGAHWLAVQTTDALGHTGTSPVVSISVSNAGSPPPTGGIGVSSSFAQNGTGKVAVNVTTSKAGQLLLAFVAADGPDNAVQTARVSGGGLTWTLVRRGNAHLGTAEVWEATAHELLSEASITSTLARDGYDQSLVVMAFDGAGGTGAATAAGAATGAPTVQLTSTKAGSLIFGVGNDWDNAVARTLAAGQTMRHQWIDLQVDTGVHNTFWVQSLKASVPSTGLPVAISDTAPTTGRWNLVAVEIVPSTPTAPDATLPTVNFAHPGNGDTVSGTATIQAKATDDTGIKDLQFFDGTPESGILIGTVTNPPFSVPWDTRSLTAGTHTLTAKATDLANNVAVKSISVTVDNSAPPPKAISQDAFVFRDGSGTLTTPAFSTSTPGDLILALVAYDGPSDRAQTATVSGGGLTWTLLKRSNGQLGTSEIWSARAENPLTNASVSASAGIGSNYHGSLTVIAFKNAQGTGVMQAAGALNGAPHISLPGVQAGSWVFAVGNDWDRAIARLPVAGQTLIHQSMDTAANKTYWVQSTPLPTGAGGLIAIADTAPTSDHWNYAAIEIVAAH
jgi:hypothetical protein